MKIQHVVEGPKVTETTHQDNGFWRRQFAPTVTRPQIIFDVLFGVIGPILCFVFDPVVFRDGFAGPPLFPAYRNFAYLFSGVEIAFLCLWLLTGPGLEVWNRIIGGIFLNGALFCAAVGLVLSPFSLIGLLYGIGIFGFTPFLAAMVYLRNSRRALRSKSPEPSNPDRILIPSLGILLATGLPLLLSIEINLAVNHAIDDIVQGDTDHAVYAAHRLTSLGFFADSELDRIVSAYRSEKDEKRKELLRSCYREITGDNLENRARINPD